MRLYTAQAMREADRKATELGYPSLLLMDAAGRRSAKRLLQYFEGRKAVVLCGKGNNGGESGKKAKHGGKRIPSVILSG